MLQTWNCNFVERSKANYKSAKMECTIVEICTSPRSPQFLHIFTSEKNCCFYTKLEFWMLKAQYYTTRHLWRIQAKYHRMYAYGLCIERTCICKQFPSISSLRLVNCSTSDWQAWNYGFLSMNLWKRPSGCWSRLQSGIPARTAAIFWLRCIPNFPLGVHCLTWTNMSWSCQ